MDTIHVETGPTNSTAVSLLSYLLRNAHSPIDGGISASTDLSFNNYSDFGVFYRSMLCIRGTSHGPVSVCLSVHPSQVRVLLKRLNVGSHKQRRKIAQGL